MAEELSSQYDPKSVEERIYASWMDKGFFQPSAEKIASRLSRIAYRITKNNSRSATRDQQKGYIILLPPPNITGSLHMGHTLNATISDILIRYHRMKGYNAVWLPGIDHAGIAAQNVVEKNLRKENISRFDLGREKFIEKVWEWKEQYGTMILDQLKRLGASCDWSRTRFTMDPEYSKWVTKAFIHYYEKGLIYRGERVVSWCPRCQTSLSDLEVEHNEEQTTLYYIQYGPFTLATVRPETKFGDTALAVHPKDKRYKQYIGKTIEVESLDVRSPLETPQKTTIKILVVGDEAADPKFGTGVIKVTPAHDMTDFEIAGRHQLPLVQIIDERGRMNEVAGKYAGMKVLAAREKVVNDLRAVGLLLKEEPYTHNTAACSRCNTVLEPLPSEQWFLKMGVLAKKSAAVVKSKKTKIVPKNFEKGFFNWLSHIKDWCISRQIWWGHRLPVWFHEPKCVPKEGRSEDVVKCKEMIVSAEEPKCKYCNAKFIQSEDVLDTWFSSALWPFAGLSDGDIKQYYPSSVLITARDIINLWVGRMIFSGLEFYKKTPFHTTLIHATILAKDGRRMSKSLGTGVDPMDYVNTHGADATRFGVIWQSMGNQDIRWDEAAVFAGKKFANKIWNASRFVLGRVSINEARKLTKPVTPADKAIIAALKKTKKTVESSIKKYEFGPALHTLYEFFWHEFCDIYLEESKNQQDRNTDALLLCILLDSLKMLHPFMPHITEEIYQKLPLEDKSWLIVESW